MKATRIREHGGLERVEWCDVDTPALRSDDVRVEIHAAGLNHLDLWVRRGLPGHKYRLPLTTGADGAGVIVEIGAAVSHVTVGDRVVIAPGIGCGTCEACLSGADHRCRDYQIFGEGRDGTHAESVVVPARNVFPLPAGVAVAEAGCFVLAALTAWTMLIERAAIRADERVLVLAGGSGVGVMAIQICRLHGCQVIATAGGPEKCAQVRALGADSVIDHSTDNIAQRVRDLTEQRGVDVVVEHVGSATWSTSLKCLARGGRLVTCGATTGFDVKLDLRHVFFKNLSLLGSTMGPIGLVPKLVRLLAAGRLRPVVAKTFPLSGARAAQAALEAHEAVGKMVLVR